MWVYLFSYHFILVFNDIKIKNILDDYNRVILKTDDEIYKYNFYNASYIQVTLI